MESRELAKQICEALADKKTLLAKRNHLLQNQLKKQEAERKEYRYVE